MKAGLTQDPLFNIIRMAPELKIDREVTPEVLEKAARELREIPEVRGPAIAELRKLVEADPTIHYKTTDDILLRYLRPTKFYPESAHSLMKREAEFKDKYKKILKDLMPIALETAISKGLPVNVFANRDQEGRRILVQHAGSVWDPSFASTDVVFQIFYLVHQAALLEEKTQINGVVVILDFAGLGLKQIAKLSPSFAVQLLSFIQEAMPLRLKGVHIVNEPFLFKGVWKIFQPLVKEKLNKRLFFHGSNRESLHKHISPSCLPPSYGGTLPEINYSSKDWYPVLKELDPVFAENNTFGLVEKK